MLKAPNTAPAVLPTEYGSINLSRDRLGVFDQIGSNFNKIEGLTKTIKMCFRPVKDFEWLKIIPTFHLTSDFVRWIHLTSDFVRRKAKIIQTLHLTSDFVRWPKSGLKLDYSGLEYSKCNDPSHVE